MPLPTSSTVTRRRSFGLDVRIGHDLYRLLDLPDIKALIQTALPQPPRIDTSANPEDIREEAGVVFSVADFRAGEGQGFYHRETSRPDRYWSSMGIDISPPSPGSAPSLRLLPTTTLISPDDTNTNLHLAHDGTALYLSSGDTILRSTDPLSPAPTFADDSPHDSETPTDIEGMVALGSVLYAALGENGIHRRVGSSWSHWSDLEPDGIWAAKGRIIASDGPALYDAADSTNSALLHTLASPHTWTGVVDAGSFILASSTDGTVYAFTYDESSTDLVLATRTPISTTEAITAISFHPSGLVFYATSEHNGTGYIGRFYRSALNETGTLTFAALIRQWGDSTSTTDQSPRFITSHRDSVYTGVDDSLEVGHSHIWRYDLETTGRSRHLTAHLPGSIPAILPLNDRLFFTRTGTDGGLYRESPTTFSPSGYLITSLADHFTSSDKNWAGVRIDVSSLAGGIVEVWYSSSPAAIHDPLHSTWIRARRITFPGQADEMPIAVQSRYLALKVVLISSGAGSSTPHITSVSTRAFPEAPDVIMDLPINVSDEIHIPYLRRVRTPGLGHQLYNRLKNIEGSNQEIVLYSPPETLLGYIEQVSTPIPALTRSGSRSYVSIVRIRARRTGSVSISSSDGGMGIEMMGINMMGGVTADA